MALKLRYNIVFVQNSASVRFSREFFIINVLQYYIYILYFIVYLQTNVTRFAIVKRKKPHYQQITSLKNAQIEFYRVTIAKLNVLCTTYSIWLIKRILQSFLFNNLQGIPQLSDVFIQKMRNLTPMPQTRTTN